MAARVRPALVYTLMDKTRWLASIYCSISLALGGCSANGSDTDAQPGAGSGSTAGAGSFAGAPSMFEGSLAVIQVETVTTVQSSAGSFLSPTPQQLVPAYVERSAASVTAAQATRQERAKIDLALLFRGTGADSDRQQLDAQLASANMAPWPAIDHYFPHLEPSQARIRWPLAVSNPSYAELDASMSPEWLGWQDFRGLGVRSPDSGTDLSVPAATLDFEARGLSSPLVLSTDGGSLLVTNRSTHAVTRALLVYSHPGGVAVTAIDALAPGEARVALLGPKERPAGELLERARGQLAEFFAGSVGAELASALAASKSIPFLETQGMRLIALLNEDLQPVVVSFSAPVASQQRVILSHSEILKPEEEARVLDVVRDPRLGAEQALATLGRFTRAKLEFAEQSADPEVSANATTLLGELSRR